MTEYPEEHEPIVRDKRRIDPATGALRSPAGATGAPGASGAQGGPETPGAPGPATATGAPPGPAPATGAGPAGPGDELASARAALAERTVDLQRVTAEYANYRRRVDRDREAVREQALAGVLTSLLPVLDDIGRARGHGELEGGFKAVADALEAVVEKLGMSRFGAEGDPFDPMVHEALTHEHRDEVTEPTVVAVLQPGYRLADRVVRPARVAVAGT